MPLALDPTTRAEYDAAQTAEARASLVLAALAGTVSVVVRDGTDAVRGTGTMQTPWATVSGTQLLIGEVSSFVVTDGGTPAAGWYLAFEAGDRWLRGTFGLADSGANFRWSLPAFTTGQNGMLGTVAARAQGRASIEASYETIWGILTSEQRDLTASWALASPEAWATIPTISFEQGTAATRDISQYLLSTGQVAHSGALPAGVTFNSTLLRYEYDGAGAVAATTGNTLEVTPFAEEIATFSMVSGVTGTMPFCFGHAFAAGDAPDFIDSDLTTFQAEIKNRWPDGSTKFAIISGIADFTAGEARTISLRQASAATSGTPVSLSTLQAAIGAGDVTLGLDPYGTVDLADLLPLTSGTAGAPQRGSPGLVRQWQSGPQCSEWHFYSPVGSDPHLAVWFHVRMFGDNSIEVETIVENGWANVPSPENKTYTPTLTINGAARYAPGAAITHCHHSRWSRADWYGTDPQTIPQHDAVYLRSTKLVPNYGWTTPTEGRWAKAVEGAALLADTNPPPFASGNYRQDMSAPGYSPTIGWVPIWDALYCASADARAYRAMVGNARLYGRFLTHYREDSAGLGHMQPIRANRPEYLRKGFSGSLNTGLKDVGGSLTQFPAASGGLVYSGQQWAISHSPSPCYAAYLATGRYAFAEEAQFASAVGFLLIRNGDQRTAQPFTLPGRGLQTRSDAWRFRTLSQAYTVTPDADPVMREDYSASLDAIYQEYAERSSAPEWANAQGRFQLGQLTVTTTGEWWCAPWQYHYFVTSVGMAHNMAAYGTPAGRDALLSVLPVMYRHPVGMLGTAETGWDYRAQHGSMTYGVGTVEPPAWHASWAVAFASFRARYPALSWSGTTINTGDVIPRSDPIRSVMFAVALAVEHGADGATEALGRLVGSSNYIFAVTNGEFDNDPTWAVVPR